MTGTVQILVGGRGYGEVLVLDQPLSFWGASTPRPVQ